MGWIGVDLDGTLAYYDGWQGAEHIGKPIPLMIERVKKWLAEGKEVRIFTARVDGGNSPEVQIAINKNPELIGFRDVALVRNTIECWCECHIGCKLQITNVKDFEMIELWDDRCVAVEKNTGLFKIQNSKNERT